MKKKINKYIYHWSKRGYPDDIEDCVPDVLMQNNLAPSYKAIALAILKNDNNFISLGFTAKKSEWYDRLKKIEIMSRKDFLK